jgi:hypothetical protein
LHRRIDNGSQYHQLIGPLGPNLKLLNSLEYQTLLIRGLLASKQVSDSICRRICIYIITDKLFSWQNHLSLK